MKEIVAIMKYFCYLFLDFVENKIVDVIHSYLLFNCVCVFHLMYTIIQYLLFIIIINSGKY